MASAVAQAYNGGRGQSCVRGPGAEPLVMGSGGEAPVKLNHFWFLGVQWKPQITHIYNLEMQRNHIFLLSLQKTSNFGKAHVTRDSSGLAT